MTDRNGNETRFDYAAVGLIAQITDPAGRQTRFAYDAAGNLTQATDPDGIARTWGDDARHLMTSEVDQLGRRESMAYDEFGRAVQATRKDGTQSSYEPLQTRALLPASQTADPLGNAVARLSSNTANYTGANGNVTTVVLDRQGQAVSSSDEVGLLPTVRRNEQNLGTRTTHARARGNATTIEYDLRGNVVGVTDTVTSGGSGGGTLFPGRKYVTGPNPAAIVSADLNADGILDLVTTKTSPSPTESWCFWATSTERFKTGCSSPREVLHGLR